jgi:hypothetical protein
MRQHGEWLSGLKGVAAKSSLTLPIVSLWDLSWGRMVPLMAWRVCSYLPASDGFSCRTIMPPSWAAFRTFEAMVAEAIAFQSCPMTLFYYPRKKANDDVIFEPKGSTALSRRAASVHQNLPRLKIEGNAKTWKSMTL